MLQSNLYLENGNLTESQTSCTAGINQRDVSSSLVELPQSKITLFEEDVLQSNSVIYQENDCQAHIPTEELTVDKEELIKEELTIVQSMQPKGTFWDGFLLVWGCGEFGQHGHGHTEDVLSGDALGSPLWLGQDRMVLEVACGSSHTLVLTDDNKMYSWGNSNSGQLGMGDTETNPQPRPLHLGVSSGTKITGITCGTRHSFIWTQDGDCFSFGNNYSGQLGYDFRKPDFKENQLRPVFVDTLLRRQVSQVACGSRHSVFLFTNGQVAAVGVNNRGQIGCGDTVDVVCAKTVPDLPPVSMIACGNCHTLAADVQGSVYAWGYGKACGSKTDILSPLCVYSSTEQNKVVDMAGGDSHSQILLSSGAVYSWGSNFEGQLGQGRSVKFLNEPKELNHNLLPGKVVSISVGENTCAAVTGDGKLYMWGKNSSQVIRDDENSRFFQFEPYLVPLGVWKALKVSCGSWHVACVVSASPKGEINKVDEENSETTAITTNIKVGTDSVSSVNIPTNEHDIEPNRDGSEVVGKPCSEEDFFPGIKFSGNEQPLTQELASCDGNEVGYELIEDVVAGEVNLSGKQNREGNDNYTSNDFNNKDNDGNSRTKYKIIDDVEKDTKNTDRSIGSNLEEKPELVDEIPTVTVHPSSVEINEEKPALIGNVLKHSDNAGKKCNGEHLTCVSAMPADEESHPTRHDGCKTTSPSLQDFTIMSTSSIKEPQEGINVTSTEVRELEQPTSEPSCTEDFFPKESDEFDVLDTTFNSKVESVETTGEEETNLVVEQKGNGSPVATRTRAFSEQPNSSCGPRGSKDIAVGLHSGSLDSLRVYHQQDGVARGLQVRASPRVTYSPPANSHRSVGHLNREKRPARMLRRTSFDVEYHLPNQPVHTVDIGVTPYIVRPHPPMNRTQSSPSLYSSNLIRSPLGARKKSSVSAKVPRPPAAATTAEGALPPRPPARGLRRPLELNPVFSSGTSWRKRK